MHRASRRLEDLRHVVLYGGFPQISGCTSNRAHAQPPARPQNHTPARIAQLIALRLSGCISDLSPKCARVFDRPGSQQACRAYPRVHDLNVGHKHFDARSRSAYELAPWSRLSPTIAQISEHALGERSISCFAKISCFSGPHRSTRRLQPISALLYQSTI